MTGRVVRIAWTLNDRRGRPFDLPLGERWLAGRIKGPGQHDIGIPKDFVSADAVMITHTRSAVIVHRLQRGNSVNVLVESPWRPAVSLQPKAMTELEEGRSVIQVTAPGLSLQIDVATGGSAPDRRRPDTLALGGRTNTSPVDEFATSPEWLVTAIAVAMSDDVIVRRPALLAAVKAWTGQTHRDFNGLLRRAAAVRGIDLGRNDVAIAALVHIARERQEFSETILDAVRTRLRALGHLW